jgi:hypothetical protein
MTKEGAKDEEVIVEKKVSGLSKREKRPVA